MQTRLAKTRNKLTDYWKESGVEKADKFALLNKIIPQEWTGLSVTNHMEIKGLKSQKIRDHMSEAKLIFTALAELSIRQIAKKEERLRKMPGFNEMFLVIKYTVLVIKNDTFLIFQNRNIVYTFLNLL